MQAVSGGADAEPLVGLANLVRHLGQLVRRRGHRHLAEEPLGLGGLAGEADTEQSAHEAASAVAADQPARAQPCAVGEFDAHPVLVLLDTGHLAAAADLCAELAGALGQQAIGDRLGDAEDVAVCGIQVRRPGFVDRGEAAGAAGILLLVCEEPVQQPTLVHDLNAARVQAEQADRLARLRVLLQHEHIHVVQPQVAGQHHPRRPAAANDHIEHVKPQSKSSPSGLRLRIADSPGAVPISAGIWPRPTILVVGRGLAASPLASYILKVARRFILLAFRMCGIGLAKTLKSPRTARDVSGENASEHLPRHR